MADIGWPQFNDEGKIGAKVDPLMRRIPIIKLNEDRLIEDTSNIVDYLIALRKFKGFKFDDQKEQQLAYFQTQWVEHWLVWLVIYGRWLREENYLRFIGTLGKDSDKGKVKKSVDYTRNRACKIVKNTEVGGLSEHSYLQNLMESFEQLETCLSDNPFMTGQSIKEIDIGVFMCLQAFYDPALNDERDLIMAYSHIRAWMKKIDSLTQTPHTRSPLLDKKSKQHND